MIGENARLMSWGKSAMKHAAVRLDERERKEALLSLRETCTFRGWKLWAAHVRASHVHVVAEAGDETHTKQERIMRDLKIYASRRLNAVTCLDRRWSRHGSTLYLWDRVSVHDAIVYVYEGQGQPMERYICPEW
jgi:REP element-mobilizing transposase RayT